MNILSKKRMLLRLSAAMLTAVLLAVCVYIYHRNTRETVLEFGTFSGSNWDVASANSFIIFDEAIERFEKSHPGVRVHYYSGVQKGDYSEWLSRKIIDGSEPDVFFVLDDDFNKFCTMKVMKPLDELIARDTEFCEEDFFSSTYATGRFDERQYALPFETVPTMMFVNKTLLTREGIEVPAEDWKWSDLYSICRKVTKDLDEDGLLDQFGIYNYGWQDAVYSNGGEIFSAKGNECSLTDEKVVESVKFVRRLNELNRGQKVMQEDFNGGNVAFMPLNFAEYRTYKTYPYKIKRYANMTWDCITMPAGEGGGNVSRVSTLLMGISAHTGKEQLAWEFLKLLTADETTQQNLFNYSQGVSVLGRVTQSPLTETIIQADMAKDDRVIGSELLARVIKNGHIEPKFKNYNQAMSLADSEIGRIIDEDRDIDSSLKILQRSVNAFLTQ